MIESRERYTAHVPRTAMKRFTPHQNTSFGCFVESPEHLRALQRQHGCEDADVSRGSSDIIPSDFDTSSYLGRIHNTPEGLDVVDNDHLEDARDENMTIDDIAAHAGVA